MQGDGSHAFIRPTNAGSVLYLGYANQNSCTVSNLGFSCPNLCLPNSSYTAPTNNLQIGFTGTDTISNATKLGVIYTSDNITFGGGTYMIFAQLYQVKFNVAPNGIAFQTTLMGTGGRQYYHSFIWNGGGIPDIQVQGVFVFSGAGKQVDNISVMISHQISSYNGGLIRYVRIA